MNFVKYMPIALNGYNSIFFASIGAHTQSFAVAMTCFGLGSVFLALAIKLYKEVK